MRTLLGSFRLVLVAFISARATATPIIINSCRVKLTNAISVIILLFLSNSAQAQVITFDDISGSLPDTYDGFAWHNFALENGANSTIQNGYANGVVSSPNVVYNYNSGDFGPATISSTSPFSLNSASFTGAWDDNLLVHAVGSGDATYSKYFTVNTNSPSSVTFNWNNLNSLAFYSLGGTPNPSLAGYGGGASFAMDNLVVNGALNLFLI